MRVIDILEPHLRPQTLRSHAIDGRIQAFVALRFFATGCVYSTTSEHHGVSEASTCRIIHRVVRVLVGMKDQYVKWPTTPAEVASNQLDFYILSGFPGVVGAVDCTHVPLDCCPYGPNEYAYVNRKGVHSINVQLICDTKYKIMNVVARWPGSTHDSRIIQNSGVGEMFERRELGGILLGDSGYPQRRWLMTPIRDPNTAAQRAYNE